MADNRLTYSIAATAALLGISTALCYKLAKRGLLPGAIKLGQRRIVVSRIQLERFLEGSKGEDQCHCLAPLD